MGTCSIAEEGLCDDLDEWHGQGAGGGRFKREGIHMHIADSLCCSAEANTTLESNYTPIKKKKSK